MAWVQEIYEKLFDPDTVCVACISHGKDSLAMLRAIKLLGLPLHRIVTTDVWATQDIPAVLPEMWEWKTEADKIIKELYGIEVEHICAMQKTSDGRCLRLGYEDMFYSGYDSGSFVGNIMDSQTQRARGVKSSSMRKLTYEDIFYRQFAKGVMTGRIYGFPIMKCEWCRSMLKTGNTDKHILATTFPTAPCARGVR